MSRIYRIALLVLTIIIVLSLFGCAKNDLSNSEEKYSIKVIVKNRSHAFWSVVQMGAETAAREFNIDLVFDGPENEEDIDGQIQLVEDAIAIDSDAIVLAASDYVRLVPVAEKAIASGIPVIVIDSTIESDKMDSFVGTDNMDAGKKVGESLIDKVGTECTIAVISFVKGAASATQRETGFAETVSDYPGVEVIETVYCNSDELLAQQLTKDIVQDNPQIDAIVCLNAYSTAGAARGIDELGLAGEIIIIGFDSTPLEITFLEKGVIQSLIVQNPFNMGYLGVKYALDSINNKKIPKNVNTGSEVIDIDNMYLPENQKLLFPFTE
ncbi:MAG: substrate-binding domain-containing protein [Clostridiales bacterium]|nr:substrate-binding domain-containing protein [Clostridiales bacterium]